MSEMTTEKFETYAKNAGEPRRITEKKSIIVGRFSLKKNSFSARASLTKMKNPSSTTVKIF